MKDEEAVVGKYRLKISRPRKKELYGRTYSILNYTEKDVPFTRIIEHKHFEFGHQNQTIITREYPEQWTVDKDAYCRRIRFEIGT